MSITDQLREAYDYAQENHISHKDAIREIFGYDDWSISDQCRVVGCCNDEAYIEATRAVERVAR